MEECDKNEKSSCLKYWDVNNLYDWAMSQKLLVNDFQLVEDISVFNGNFKKAIIMKVMKNLFSLHNDLSFLPERMKIGKAENTMKR